MSHVPTMQNRKWYPKNIWIKCYDRSSLLTQRIWGSFMEMVLFTRIFRVGNACTHIRTKNNPSWGRFFKSIKKAWSIYEKPLAICWSCAVLLNGCTTAILDRSHLPQARLFHLARLVSAHYYKCSQWHTHTKVHTHFQSSSPFRTTLKANTEYYSK